MRNALVFVFISIVGLGIYTYANFFGAQFLSASEAQQKWKVVPLDKEKFRSGKIENRAGMAVQILKESKYVGEPMLKVKSDLGRPDSYFFSDTIFAYKIMKFPGKDIEEWHLVFIPDEKLEKVKEVKIHKKCCYESPL